AGERAGVTVPDSGERRGRDAGSPRPRGTRPWPGRRLPRRRDDGGRRGGDQRDRLPGGGAGSQRDPNHHGPDDLRDARAAHAGRQHSAVARFPSQPRLWHAARMDPDTQAAAIILAAGAGRRLGAEIPKAFLPIGERPMLAVAAAAAAASPPIAAIVVAAPAGYEDAAR